MLTPEVEARFRKIEDDLAVTAELQRRAELRAKDDIEHLRAVQAAMARWQDEMAEKQEALVDAQIRGEAATQELRATIAELSQTVAELSRTVDRFLRHRSDGGVN